MDYNNWKPEKFYLSHFFKQAYLITTDMEECHYAVGWNNVIMQCVCSNKSTVFRKIPLII